MTTSVIKIEVPNANDVIVTDDSLIIELDDGRTVSVPTAWYPRLLNASKKERENWRLLGKGCGIHWESLDEDISVEGILTGQPSGESQASFKKWIESRIEK
ncbi:MAG: DUF2442 domain-containing protein [Desulfobacula sp.]|jgi:hypothetical protein|nr:DUF2442 domain-containing protein [Desulfobacula sp.]MBT6340653.1 DUF2442 domain-containing protein [Desulfobacula sp.]